MSPLQRPQAREQPHGPGFLGGDVSEAGGISTGHSNEGIQPQQEGQSQRASGKKKERVGNLEGGQEGFLCGSRQPGLGPAPPPAAGADLWRPRERSELERVSLIN